MAAEARAFQPGGEAVITRLADASRLGYKSEAAFAGAFKRVLGIPPGADKRGRDPAAPEAVAAS